MSTVWLAIPTERLSIHVSVYISVCITHHLGRPGVLEPGAAWTLAVLEAVVPVVTQVLYRGRAGLQSRPYSRPVGGACSRRSPLGPHGLLTASFVHHHSHCCPDCLPSLTPKQLAMDFPSSVLWTVSDIHVCCTQCRVKITCSPASTSISPCRRSFGVGLWNIAAVVTVSCDWPARRGSFCQHCSILPHFER